MLESTIGKPGASELSGEEVFCKNMKFSKFIIAIRRISGPGLAEEKNQQLNRFKASVKNENYKISEKDVKK